MTNVQPPDAMKSLVLLIIGIAMLGSVIALAVHYGVELPAQKAIQAPMNLDPQDRYLFQQCFTCKENCITECAHKNPTGGTPEFYNCVNTCQAGCNCKY